MSDLSYEEKITIALLRNAKKEKVPSSKKDFATKFNLSQTYVNQLISGIKRGRKAREWREKFSKYAGVEQ